MAKITKPLGTLNQAFNNKLFYSIFKGQDELFKQLIDDINKITTREYVTDKEPDVKSLNTINDIMLKVLKWKEQAQALYSNIKTPEITPNMALRKISSVLQSKSWRDLIKAQEMEFKDIYSSIIEIAVKNVTDRMKSIPDTYYNQLEKLITRRFNTDIRGDNSKYVQAVHNMLKFKYKSIKNYAFNLSSSVMRKADQHANFEIAKRAGVDDFVWVHIGGIYTDRIIHKRLNGTVFNKDNLPVIDIRQGVEVRGLPGELMNCRCLMRLVI